MVSPHSSHWKTLLSCLLNLWCLMVSIGTPSPHSSQIWQPSSSISILLPFQSECSNENSCWIFIYTFAKMCKTGELISSLQTIQIPVQKYWICRRFLFIKSLVGIVSQIFSQLLGYVQSQTPWGFWVIQYCSILDGIIGIIIVFYLEAWSRWFGMNDWIGAWVMMQS